MSDTLKKPRVVILGGYGVFGGKLAETLLRNTALDVVVAGRRLEKAKAFCAGIGGTPAYLDRTARDFEDTLQNLAPFITVDAAGPFQTMPDNRYRVVEAALDAGSHYLDLSDDAKFTGGISAFDQRARDSDLVVLSGVSSVPALSSTVVEHLKPGFQEIDLIEMAILPGNRAPRGLSVIEAILAQTGKPLAITRDGRKDFVPGWSGLRRDTLTMPDGAAPLRRWASHNGAPDLALFPEHYKARSVLFRAGLELSVMHLGLWMLSWLVRLRLVGSLVPLARLLRSVADLLAPLGSDRGGMYVKVAGPDLDGQPVSKRWTLTAKSGDGPHVPAIAAAIMCEKIRSASATPGARACLGEFDLEDFKAAVAHLAISTHEDEDRSPTLFQKALGPTFDTLPSAVQALHTVFDRREWRGCAKVTRGTSRLGKLVCAVVGFPPASEDVPVTVIIKRKGEREIWQRTFGAKSFQSELSLRQPSGTGHIRERFGLMRFDIDLTLEDEKLTFPVRRGTFLGLPFPRWLLPISVASETSENGRFTFDIAVSLPRIGELVRYQGWLEPRYCIERHPSEEKMQTFSESF